MPSWIRKIGESPLQYDAYRLAKALELIAKAASGCCNTTTTTTTEAP